MSEAAGRQEGGKRTGAVSGVKASPDWISEFSWQHRILAAPGGAPLGRQPSSFHLPCSFLVAVAGGLVKLPSEWCSRDGRFTEDRVTLGQAGRAVFGQATFFVTHAWSYK